jgi:hypothetical protein
MCRFAKHPIAFLLLQAPFSLWTGAKVTLDMLGRASVAHDLAQPESMPWKIVDWILSTPWWVPAILASSIAGVWIYYVLPAGRAETKSGREQPGGDLTTDDESPAFWEARNTEAWNSSLIPVIGVNYVNDLVKLDGKEFVNCTFRNVSPQHNGVRGFFMTDCKFEGERTIKYVTQNPAVLSTLQLLAMTSTVKIGAPVYRRHRLP